MATVIRVCSLAVVFALFAACQQTEIRIDAAQAKESLCAHVSGVWTVITPEKEAETERFIAALAVDQKLLRAAGDTATADKVATAIRDLRTGTTGRVEISVFLRMEISEGVRNEIDATLKNHPSVASYEYVSAEQAYEEFVEAYKDKPEFYEDLPTDALPSSFRIKTATATPSEDLIAELQALRGVDDVRGGGQIEMLIGPLQPLMDLCGVTFPF